MMDFLPGSIGITGHAKEIEALDEIKNTLNKYEGLLGYKLPSIGISDKANIPSFVGIVENQCILLIDIVLRKVIDVTDDGEFWKYEGNEDVISRDIVLDRFESEIKNRLIEDNKLYNRRDATFKIPTVKLLFYCNNSFEELETFYKNGNILNAYNSYDDINSAIKSTVEKHSFPDGLSTNVFSLLEGTKAFEKKEKILPTKELNTLSDFANRSLITTFMLDQEQRKVSMQLPQGPQRIRGLAGTGKTVILALKAALTHKELPDYKILFTFNTQSMYNQTRNLISKYFIYENRREPNWENLHVMHAWGGSTKPGVYSATCKLFGVTPFNFAQVRGYKDPYEYIFNDLLSKVKKLKFEPIYDMVLIDEAQDFPQPFFELIYLLTKKPKRIIWAYDEFQSLNDLRIKEPQELFGLDRDGNPNLNNETLSGQYIGGIDKDFILPNSYRNPRISLMAAHGIGLGLYRKEGIIDILSDKRSWRALGYEVLAPAKETYSEGDQMDIERPEKYSKNILENLLREMGKSEKDLLKIQKFKDKENEYRFVVTEISRLINTENFKPEQIIVISLASTKTKAIFAFIRQLLDSQNIKCITPGFVESSDMFQESGFITLTTPYRAKGNESEVVFVIDSDNIMTNYSFAARNAAFVSITRSRGWCYITGSGERMEKLTVELTELIANYPNFKFPFPSEEEIKRRRIVFKKNSEEVERSGQQLDKLIEENPELLIEILKTRPDLIDKIKREK